LAEAIIGRWSFKVLLAAVLERIIFIIAVIVISDLIVTDIVVVVEIPCPWSACSWLRGWLGSAGCGNRTRGWLGGWLRGWLRGVG